MISGQSRCRKKAHFFDQALHVLGGAPFSQGGADRRNSWFWG
jgi:hypothetical protein